MSARRRRAGHVVLTCDTFGCHAEFVATHYLHRPIHVRAEAGKADWKRPMLNTGEGFRHFDLCPEHKELTA